MYLQSLELHGFKSFAQKTTLQFHRGVTAIVGPNGCGKSNVLDAIRWVLGEQSAKALRGGEMADVIFGGTDSRQALGMGEVSMTFADCEKELGVEWNEVRITRRVFRDGRGEYLLNKTPCRLKDIHQLFMDTGIGRSAYSIMEQGKIDQILSSRPEDRRAIFEEAAGITKYKSQKKEALRKLEYTEANLLRVSDIIKEVKRQIGSLQRQAAKARRYQSLTGGLRIFDTHLSHRQFVELDTERNSLTSQVGQIEDSREVYENEISSQEVELAGYRARLQELDAEIGQARDHVQTLRSRIYSAESRIESHGQRSVEFGELIERNRADIAITEQKTREQENQLLETNELIERLGNSLYKAQDALASQEQQVQSVRSERVQSERELQSAAQEYSRAESDFSRLRGELSNIGARREGVEARLSMLNGESAMAGELLQDIDQRTTRAAERIQVVIAHLGELEAALAQANDEQIQAQLEKESIETEASQIDRRQAETNSRLEVLLQLEADGEGLGEATQAILHGLNNPDFYQPAVVGALASLIRVEPDYANAVTAVLGVQLQTVLFKDSEIAESALRVLTEQSLGRGSILPREWIPAGTPSLHTSLPEGALTWALNCVQSPEEIRELVAQFLDGVVIVADLSTAFNLRRHHPGLSFATVEGEFISKEGIATGGKVSGSVSSALLRKNQIADLEVQLTQINVEAGEIAQRRENAAARFELAASQLAQLREETQRLQVERSMADSESRLLERERADALNRSEHFNREIAQLSQQLEQSAAQMQELESRMGDADLQMQETLARRSALEQLLGGLREREEGAVELLNEQRICVATERQRQQSLEIQRSPMAARLQELSGVVTQRENDIAHYESRITQLQAESEELRSGILAWNDELEIGESHGSALVAQRNEVQESAGSIESSLGISRRRLSELQDNRGRLEVRSTQIELRLENIKDHIQRRYSIDLSTFEPDRYGLLSALKEQKVRGEETASDAPAEPMAEDGADVSVFLSPEPQEIPWDKIEALVAEMTERVDSMGPVNMDAIQEYDELEERHQFLEQQINDLTQSKAELLEVIARINVTTQQLFAETFEKVRINFQEMFTELFGGGKANLLLSDESDPLECGIEIIARPPGKQLQSVSLLSGGERTMAAVALLFSIYMVKPSPFCVLDEMDAPLDESNISRFVKILDRFVDQSQFVVITHNKRTISRADMLYGVTMEEHGVSKVVSVKFGGKEETGAQSKSVAATFGKSEDLHSQQIAEVPAEAQ